MILSIINLNGNVQLIIDLLLSLLVVSFIMFRCIKFKLTKKFILVVGLSFILSIIAYILGLQLLLYSNFLFVAFYVTYSSIIMSKPEKEKLLRANKHVSRKVKKLSENETSSLFDNLNKAISYLSETKTGALITIEKKDNMDEFMKYSGVRIDAPVTPELIETIFFDKTPLHDGASIIRGNMIISSAVFYQPTQKPLTGKYGSRHRAAIGISEVSDSLTIVVSEETGKVSFAYKGDLISVPVAKFVDKLKEYYAL